MPKDQDKMKKSNIGPQDRSTEQTGDRSGGQNKDRSGNKETNRQSGNKEAGD